MSNNPFKAGDKVVRLAGHIDRGFVKNQVYTVAYIAPGNSTAPSVHLKDGPTVVGFSGPWDSSKFRAAIKGVDYDVPGCPHGHASAAVYQGHLPDGSSVQAHSAGGLYPVVLVFRDKARGPDANGKCDVGFTSPKNLDPIWFKSYAAAVAVAEAIKANL